MRRSTAFLLALGIVVLLAGNSADFFFRQPYYETWDSAANSLSILRAKHFAQLYGAYSRYVFYHPSPALFYVHALGEWLFYDLLHLVPTPFQGQLLINLCLMAGFFAAALSVFVHWLPGSRRGLFLCVALGLGILHFGAMGNINSLYDLLGGTTAFLSVWPVHALVLPFLGLLAAGASVGAGRGRDLPLLVVAGGFLVIHVAQPLFVVATAAVAYGGLVVGCARRRSAAGGPARGAWWLAAWRDGPRAHLLAGGLLVLFALPMVIDLCWGRQSNFAAILQHLHDQAKDRKNLARSAVYFLLYGSYAPYRVGKNYFGYYDLGGFLAHLRAHVLLYLGWLVVLGLVLQAPLVYLGTRARPRAEAASTVPPLADTRRFLAWAALIFGLNVVLSLYWGTRQDGQMFYYNSWFNFAIYYFGLLIAVAVLCTAWLGVEARLAGAGRLGARLLGVGAVILIAVHSAGRLRIYNFYDPEGTRATHDNVARAIATQDANHPAVCKVLYLPDDYWPVCVGVGLQLARAGDAFVVRGRWQNTLGAQYDWRNLTEKGLKGGLFPWYIVPRGTRPPGVPADAPVIPLRGDAVLMVSPPPLALSAAGSTLDLRFVHDGNAARLGVGGWGVAEPFGTWSEEHWSALAFRPQAVHGSRVDLVVSGIPFLAPAYGVTRQRGRLYLNGTLFGPEQQLAAPGTMPFSLPAAAWNAAAANADPMISLVFEFPDAKSPSTLVPGNSNGDPRILGVFFQQVRLQVVP